MIDAPAVPVLRVREGTVLLVSADRSWLASATAFLVASTRALSTAETASEAVQSAMSHPPDVAVIAPTAHSTTVSDPLRRVERGPLSLYPAAKRLTVGGVDVELSAREFAVLVALAVAAGRLMTAEELASAVGARRGPNTSPMITELIDSLYEKLGAARGLLESSRRHGYRLRFVAPL